MTLDTDTYFDGGIDRHEQPIEPDEPVGFEPGGTMISDAETRATTTGAATATAPDFSKWREEAESRVAGFGKAFNDLRGCSPRPDATEGGGILPAASGEIAS